MTRTVEHKAQIQPQMPQPLEHPIAWSCCPNALKKIATHHTQAPLLKPLLFLPLDPYLREHPMLVRKRLRKRVSQVLEALRFILRD